MIEFRNINAVNLQLRSYDSALGKWSEYNTTSRESFGNSGMGGGAAWYKCTILKFTVPKYSGLPKFTSIKLSVYEVYGVLSNSTVAHYAICTSDSNKNRYITTDSVNDPNQIASGNLTFTKNQGTKSFEISLELESNKTYYLFLWGGDEVSLNNATNHTITVKYISGFAYIDDGSEFTLYQCFIDNGSGWDMYIPYIDNGTSWDMYS